MNEYRDTLVLSATALVLSAAWVLTGIAGLWVDTSSSLMRGGLTLGWLLLVGGVVLVAIRRANRGLESSYRSLDLLSRISLADFAAMDQTDQLPTVPTHSQWHGPLERIKALIQESSRRYEDAEQRRTAVEIRARRNEARCERIEGILASLVEPVVVVDGYDELVLANPSAEKLLGFDAQQAEQRVLAQLTRCQELVDLLGETRRRRGPTTRTDEVELTGPDGNTRWYSITASNMAGQKEGDQDPSNQGAVAVLRDISGQKAIQKRNAEFVSAVSHEMKTPLAGIKAYVEMLADGDAEDEATQEEFLSIINGQADRLRRLIDNLLNLARIESGVVKVNKTTCSLNELLEEAFNVVRPSAESKRIQLVSEPSPMYLGALVDRDQMLQAAINLLSNAIKYTHPEGRVTLRSRLVDKQVQFEVEDTGVGLSEEDSRRVFDKFYRVQKDKQMAPGTGLGLPLAKYIVEDVHGGQLTLESKLDVGSTFIVTLPSAGELS